MVEFSRFVAARAPASALVDPEMLRSSFNRLDVRTPNTWGYWESSFLIEFQPGEVPYVYESCCTYAFSQVDLFSQNIWGGR